MKFLAECFNYKVIHTDALFGLLYRLINWEISTNAPDERMALLDSPDDCFRIRLVCTLLDSLGKFFNKGKRALLMDRFLIFFQRYIFTKHYILMDLEFMILDTFDNVKRKTPKLASLEEANHACNQIVFAEANFRASVDLNCPESVAEALKSFESVASLLQQYSAGDAHREKEDPVPESSEIETQPNLI
jgi:regulator of nonsense transcripts 2